MIKIAICDDELVTLTSLHKILDYSSLTIDFDMKISCVTNDQNEIYNLIKNHEIDVLFLDIQFNNSEANGIDFALKLRKINKIFKLVFITGHFEYAMLAYGCKTFDYILKPFDINKATQILTRLRDEFVCNTSTFIKLNKDYTVRTNDIFFIERNKSKTTIYTKDSTYESCYSLNAIKDELPSSFLRIHRSYIVNPNEISRINKSDKIIYFNNGLNCPLGQFEHLI